MDEDAVTTKMVAELCIISIVLKMVEHIRELPAVVKAGDYIKFCILIESFKKPLGWWSIHQLMQQCHRAIIFKHNDIVKKCIDLMGEMNEWAYRHFYMKCLAYACQYENFEIIQLVESFGIDFRPDDLEGCLKYACRSGNIEIIDHIISKGIVYWNGGLIGACWNGDRTLVDKMVALAESNAFSLNFNLALWVTCSRGGSHHLLPYLIERGANGWQSALSGACYGGHLELAKQMLEKCECLGGINDDGFTEALCCACECESRRYEDRKSVV